MAKPPKPVEPRRKSILQLDGIHPVHGEFFQLTFYNDGCVRIIRPWSCLIYRREMEVLEEKAFNHRFLIWRLQEENQKHMPHEQRSFWKSGPACETESEGEGDQNQD